MRHVLAKMTRWAIPLWQLDTNCASVELDPVSAVELPHQRTSQQLHGSDTWATARTLRITAYIMERRTINTPRDYAEPHE
jgi:hypothetical protein